MSEPKNNPIEGWEEMIPLPDTVQTAEQFADWIQHGIVPESLAPKVEEKTPH